MQVHVQNALECVLAMDLRVALCAYLRAREVRALGLASRSLCEDARAEEVWRLIAARDCPRAQWAALWHAATSPRSAYYAATHPRRHPRQTCIFCRSALGAEAEHVLLLCTCLELPQKGQV